MLLSTLFLGTKIGYKSYMMSSRAVSLLLHSWHTDTAT